MLQKEFGLSADEVLYERPSWEIENLLAIRKREREQAAGAALEEG